MIRLLSTATKLALVLVSLVVLGGVIVAASFDCVTGSSRDNAPEIHDKRHMSSGPGALTPVTVSVVETIAPSTVAVADVRVMISMSPAIPIVTPVNLKLSIPTKPPLVMLRLVVPE